MLSPLARSPLPVPVVLQKVLQPTSSPSWLLGLLYSLLLLAHAAPLVIIAMACGLLEAPAISQFFEIETHGANRKVWCSVTAPDAPLQPLVKHPTSLAYSHPPFSPPTHRTNPLPRRRCRAGPRSPACSSPSARSPSAQCSCCGTAARETGSPELGTCHAPQGYKAGGQGVEVQAFRRARVARVGG